MVTPTDANNGPQPITFRLLPSRLPDRPFIPALTCTIRGVEVVRILSPDLGEPFISLSRILLLPTPSSTHSHPLPLTPAQALSNFSLSLPTSYDLALANLAPFDDLWVSLKTARRVARELGVEGELGALLEWGGRRGMGDVRMDESGRCVLIRNWKARMPLSPAPFSPFYQLEILSERYITTLDPAELHKLRESPLSEKEEAFLKAWERVTVWSSYAYEEWKDSQSTGHKTKSVSFEDTSSLSLQQAFPPLLFEATHALQTLISLSLPSSSSSQPNTSSTPSHPPPTPAPGGRPTLQSILDLTNTHAQILLLLRDLTSALDAPDRRGMRAWLRSVPANPSPVPGAGAGAGESPVPSPASDGLGAALSGDVLKGGGGHQQLTPPSSPKKVKALGQGHSMSTSNLLDGAGGKVMNGTNGKPNKDPSETERDSLVSRLRQAERQSQSLALRVKELESAEKRARELELRLAALGGLESGVMQTDPTGQVAEIQEGEKKGFGEEDANEKEEEVRGGEEVSVDEEAEEELLVRLEQKRDGRSTPCSSSSPSACSSFPPSPSPLPSSAVAAGAKIKGALTTTPLCTRARRPPSPSPERSTNGRQTRSSSPESDTSTIRPTSPLQLSASDEDSSQLGSNTQQKQKEKKKQKQTTKRRRIGVVRWLGVWSGLVVLVLGVWMGAGQLRLVGVPNMGGVVPVVGQLAPELGKALPDMGKVKEALPDMGKVQEVVKEGQKVVHSVVESVETLASAGVEELGWLKEVVGEEVGELKDRLGYA